MANTDLDERLTVRITSGERRALEQLAASRAADMRAQNMPGDDSLGGWVRTAIRTAARTAGIDVDAGGVETTGAPSPAPAVKATRQKGRR